MIFNTNTTSLSNNIPMAEGYDGSIGAALALVESARNDYSMFRAMLDIDARECQLMRESTGYVNESELQVLQEGTISGIWNKIKELFKKLIAKIKAIFHVFISKIESLWKSDKKMVKKYEKELYRKSHIGNLEVSWIKIDDNYINALNIRDYSTTDSNDWKEETEDRDLFYAKSIGVSDVDSFDEELDNTYCDGGDAETVELKEIGGIRNICTFLDSYDKDLRELNKRCGNLTKAAEKIVKEVDKLSGDISKSYGSKDKTANIRSVETRDDDSKEDRKMVVKTSYGDFNVSGNKDIMDGANHAYDMAISYQNIVLKAVRWTLDTNKKLYKQTKSAFMKAIAANDKKLEESAIYAQAVAEAAEQEVEDVISGALSKEELSDICNASKTVMDIGVSDKDLTYGPDSYYTDMSEVDTDGYVDNNIKGSYTSVKSESSIFGQLLY